MVPFRGGWCWWCCAPIVPPHMEYRLTPLGEEVAEQVESLASWIEHNLPRIMQARPDQMPVGARLAREER